MGKKALIKKKIDEIKQLADKNEPIDFLLYIVTIERPFDLDFILVKASSKENAWDVFWEKIKDDPNFNNDDDLGKKECYFNPYEDDSTRFVRKNATIQIDIEKIDLTEDKCFKYIGGGRSV